MKDGLHDIAVSASQNLAENGAGDLDIEGFALGPVQPRRLEPGRKSVDADAGLHPVQELIPGIHSFALTLRLGCRRHLEEKKKNPCYFHRCEKTVESKSVRVSTGFGILARAGTLRYAPVAPRAARLELSAHVPPL